MTDTTAAQAVAVRVEHVIWQPGSEWDDAVDHVAARFARSSPVDLDAVRADSTFESQHAVLARWAAAAGVDLDRELGRFLDEHLAMHLRPDPKVTRAVRALAASGPVHAVSVLGPRSAESLLRHAGCWRSIATLHAGVVDESAATDLPTDARWISELGG